jgi:hypothetical protein
VSESPRPPEAGAKDRGASAARAALLQRQLASLAPDRLLDREGAASPVHTTTELVAWAERTCARSQLLVREAKDLRETAFALRDTLRRRFR